MKCNNCSKEIINPRYNQKYCSNECREEKYDYNRLQEKKLNPCEICGFWRFTESHHIIKQLEWGSNCQENLITLCPNHHKLADSKRYGFQFLKLLKKKTGKIGKKLSPEEISEVKKYILSKLKKNRPSIKHSEDSFDFYYEHKMLIQWGEFYRIAHKDFKKPPKSVQNGYI